MYSFDPCSVSSRRADATGGAEHEHPYPRNQTEYPPPPTPPPHTHPTPHPHTPPPPPPPTPPVAETNIGRVACTMSQRRETVENTIIYSVF